MKTPTPNEACAIALRHPDYDARCAKLRELWSGPSTIREIAAAIGVTHNAVVGMRYRLKLPARATPIKARAENPRHVVSGWHKPIVVKANLPKPKPVLATDPTPNPGHRRCHFPLWGPHEKIDRLFCGAPVGRAPYCDHHRIACIARRTPEEAPPENP